MQSSGVQEQNGADNDECGNGTGVRDARGARGKGGKGRAGLARAVADATVLAKYVVLVVRAKAAAREAARRAAVWFLRRREERRACVRAGGSVSGGAAEGTGPERTGGAGGAGKVPERACVRGASPERCHVPSFGGGNRRRAKRATLRGAAG